MRVVVVLLAAAAVLGAAAAVFRLPAASSQPIPPPDLASCRPPSMLPAAETPFNCCAPISPNPPIDFALNSSSPPARLRLRRPAHLLSRQELQRLVRGYRLMRALPPEDPRSFYQQANIHCAYCNMVYLQPGTNVTYQVHGSWLFFSFHRWYLYFHERILAWLLDDDTFALPYWNYDNPEAASMPRMYVEEEELYDKIRERRHMEEGAVVDMDYYNATDDRTAEQQVEENQQILRFVMEIWGGTRYGFFGRPLRLGGQFPGIGSAEFSPHNTVHAWVGDRRAIGWRDMGSLYAAARDPIFYAHHANLDRLWDVWKTMSPNNTDIDEYDYLESGFSFYDEQARLVRVRVRDSLSSSLLGYTYEEASDSWLSSPPPPSLSRTVPAHFDPSIHKRCPLDASSPIPSPSCSLELAVPPLQTNSSSSSSNSSSDDHHQLCLVISGIRVLSWLSDARFDVFVNLPNATSSTPIASAEYAGSFDMLPQSGRSSPNFHSQLLLPSLSHIVSRLALANQTHLLVTIVPKSASPCSISHISILSPCESASAAAQDYHLLPAPASPQYS